MIAILFPGQGSQKPGMGQELANNYEQAKSVFRDVSNATGVDMEELCWNTDVDTLRQTENAQLALFTCGLAAYKTLARHTKATLGVVAGHSVGEYAALVAAGIFDLADAAQMVKARGLTMAQAEAGAMSAVLGLDAAELMQLCAEADGVVAVANDNSPGQVVISGEFGAVAEVSERASAAGAKRVIPLNVSGAFHSPLMADAARQMRPVFDSYETKEPRKNIYSNVTSEIELEGALWPELLEKQLESPVRWTETIQHMSRDGINLTIECGVGDVLSGLVRRIDKEIRCLKVNDEATLQETLTAIAPGS